MFYNLYSKPTILIIKCLARDLSDTIGFRLRSFKKISGCSLEYMTGSNFTIFTSSRVVLLWWYLAREAQRRNKQIPRRKKESLSRNQRIKTSRWPKNKENVRNHHRVETSKSPFTRNYTSFLLLTKIIFYHLRPIIWEPVVLCIAQSLVIKSFGLYFTELSSCLRDRYVVQNSPPLGLPNHSPYPSPQTPILRRYASRTFQKTYWV